MGEIVMAAKITHVPTMLLSLRPGRLEGCRQQAIDGHKEIARRAREAGADTVIVLDTHWLINAGYHINAGAHFKGVYTSHEFPQFIQDLEYDYEGLPELGEAIAARAMDKGVHCESHNIESLTLEYGTLVPMWFMNPDSDLKVVSVAAMCTVHSHESSRMMGEAIAEAVKESNHKVLLLASGSLSHKIWANEDYAANNGTFTISSEFNRQVDLRVLELWKRGEHDAFLKMLPEYADYCCGEGSMHDTAMLYGALGWDKYDKKCEQVGEYFPSSGTGQANVIFPLPG
ncbi:MAG: 3,4-dihydroxyphenylacetate 2,3-dioxygenase [Bacteroidia bacterium]|nr:3,4-dihydroxyphenylacetate 2,3-dioxygenase [Bacteroidia bacterium]MBT8229264.1 3,4-dihydroxyphenylacetate 2,3-dioxygenase [Bacteroidia bacterium]